MPVVALGVAGYAFAARDRAREWLPAALLTAWFGGLLLLDYDASPDLFVVVPAAALGVGYAVAARPRIRGRALRRPLVAGVLVLAALSVGTLGAMPGAVEPRATVEPYDSSASLDPALPYNRTEAQYVFWNEVPPPSCRLFGAVTQREVVRAAELVPPDEPWRAAPCGRFGPLAEAVAEKYS
ncbi:hypothetical protein [Halosegnis marinus]|uniref:hypothetical protein n=1 Tax=Halosegnis marinus TaxID=3034023 RepID=UPI003605EC7F